MRSQVMRRVRRSSVVTVGVISDTHGHLYAGVLRALEGVDHIIHAGDIGSPQVLEGLRAVAPVTAVRGNCDVDSWAESLPISTEVEIAGVRILVGHIARGLRGTLEGDRERRGKVGARCGYDVVVSGHSHRVEKEEREGVLHLNPGSAGPERLGHPRTVARLVISPVFQENSYTRVSSRAKARASAQVIARPHLSVEFLVVPGS